MNTNVQRIRTAIITSRLIGPLVRWGWKQYVTAIAINAPNDCAEIPKVPDAGRCVSDLDGPCQIMHNGLKVKLGTYYGDLNTTIIEKLHGHHEPQEELAFHRVLQHLPETPVMIEAGSYWGYYSLWFKKERPSGSVFLIEPIDDRLEIGISNFRLNNMKGEFLRAYVGATCKPAHSVKMEGTVVKDVERISIDEFMTRYGISHVDLLHADVQGAELDLLEGAEKALRGGRLSYIFLSTHGERVHDDCTNRLTRQNFQIIASHTRAESFTTDGLIVAKNCNIEGLTGVPISKKHSSVLQDLRLVAQHVLSTHS
jgi:FkbM family methyltransferase